MVLILHAWFKMKCKRLFVSIPDKNLSKVGFGQQDSPALGSHLLPWLRVREWQAKVCWEPGLPEWQLVLSKVVTAGVHRPSGKAGQNRRAAVSLPTCQPGPRTAAKFALFFLQRLPASCSAFINARLFNPSRPPRPPRTHTPQPILPRRGLAQLISGQMSRSPGEGPPFKCRLPERKWDQTRWHTGEAEQLPANTMAPGRFISGRAALGLAFSPARVLTDHSPPPTIWDVSCDGEGAAGWEAVCETGAVPSPLRSALHLAPYTPASQAALPYPTPSSALTSKAWLENQRPRFKGKGMEEIKKATVGGVWGAGRMGANSHHTDIDMPIDIDGLPWWLRP